MCSTPSKSFSGAVQSPAKLKLQWSAFSASWDVWKLSVHCSNEGLVFPFSARCRYASVNAPNSCYKLTCNGNRTELSVICMCKRTACCPVWK